MSTLFQLFFSFLRVGLFSVGGGYAAIPLIQNQVVFVYQLMTMEEFTDLITIAEMTPGPISINASTFVGIRVSGSFGAIVCTVGCILPSMILCLILAYFYYKYRAFRGVQTVLGAMRPAVVSLIGSAALSILVLCIFNSSLNDIKIENFRTIEFLLFVGALSLLRFSKKRVSAIKVIFGTGILGTLLYLVLG